MNNLDDNMIFKKIEIDKNHIDNFPLEIEDGTKRSKKKFHEKAVNDRNEYVNRQRTLFDRYRIEIENEMVQRIKQLTPPDRTLEYDEDNKRVEQLLELVKLNSNISSSFKLKIDFIVSDITEDASLEEINNVISKFIKKFSDLGINLTIEDFSYSMFTEQYMNSFLNNSSLDEMKVVFEKVYFRCPDIILHLKMNLLNIIEKYTKELDQYVEKLKEKKFLEHNIGDKDIIEMYTEARNKTGREIAIDPYYNSSLFTNGEKKIADYVEGSMARNKNYDMFAYDNNYAELSDEAKMNYNSAVMGLYLTLNELKKYYSYEFILKDLLKRYKDKDSVKGQYASKKKEIDKEEKKRIGIYKSFLKASGIGLFAKKNELKIKDAMLKMNEQIQKLNTLYEELNDLEINNNLSQLLESASIYDLFICGLTSFPFLEKCFKKEEKFEEFTLEDNINEYFRFIYNPNNGILRKTNVFADYDIVSVVAEKYKLLNLVVTSEMIDRDNIDSTMDSVKFINLIQNIELSNITLHDIEVLCNMKKIVDDRESNSGEVV